MVKYPYRVRVVDPELCELLKTVSRKRAAKITDQGLARKAGIKLKPVRRDVFIGTDNRHYRSYIALPPELELDFKPAYGNKKGLDFYFKSIFEL